jgi:hypothetical protein
VLVTEPRSFRGHLQAESKCNTSPQPLQVPAEPKRSAEGNGHSNDVITEEVDPAPDSLPAQAPQEPVAIRRQGIEELERGADREHASNEIDDLLVVREELGDVVAERREEDDVEQPDDAGSAEGLDYISSGGGQGGRVYVPPWR